MTPCKHCGGFGVICVKYHESEGFDLAACSCLAGRFWRRTDVIRAWAAREGIQPVQIGRVEDFE